MVCSEKKNKRMLYKNSEHLYQSLITLQSLKCNYMVFVDALELVELLISVAAFLKKTTSYFEIFSYVYLLACLGEISKHLICVNVASNPV